MEDTFNRYEIALRYLADNSILPDGDEIPTPVSLFAREVLEGNWQQPENMQ